MTFLTAENADSRGRTHANMFSRRAPSGASVLSGSFFCFTVDRIKRSGNFVIGAKRVARLSRAARKPAGLEIRPT